jgi:cytochrome c biogenesis protein ResB
MNSDWVKQATKDWGTAILLVMVGLMMLGVWSELRRVGQQELNVLAAKQRIEQDRAIAAETRDKVNKMENRLETGGVPDRLERIETTIATAVKQNQESIEKLDEKQRKVVTSLTRILDVPKEEIDGTPESALPANPVKVEPK